MIFSTFIFIIFYLIIVFSSLGFGLFFFKIIRINVKNFNFGYAGLCGIFFLIFISFITHFFLPHNSLHNSIISGLHNFITNSEIKYSDEIITGLLLLSL